MAGADPVVLPDGLTPRKVIGVHLNYRSRAAQRGRVPTEPSYFLKPTTSLSGGGEIVRPRGTELLAFEAEIAVIIGTRARNVTPVQAGNHIGWYAPANDFGLHDFRWADRGSNVMAKGQDGFSPIGPAMAAQGVDPATLHLTSTVNGEVRQDATGEDLIFTFAQLVADLSRFMTLEPGDVILTGTPANSRPMEPGDSVAVEVSGLGRLENTVVDWDVDLAGPGEQLQVSANTLHVALAVPEDEAERAVAAGEVG